jgi:hypothetical protein
MSGIAGKSIVTDGLVLHLDAANRKSYPGSGTVITDLSGNAIIGTLINGPVFNSGNAGTIAFDGTNDGINVGNISPTTGLTINVWVFVNGQNSSYGVICSNWNHNNSFFIGTKPSNSSSIIVYMAGAEKFTFPGQTLSKWMLVTITNTGSSTSGYINGVVTNTASAALAAASGGVTSFGYDINRSNYPLKGSITQAQIYNRALTATEVLQNYNATKARYGL